MERVLSDLLHSLYDPEVMVLCACTVGGGLLNQGGHGVSMIFMGIWIMFKQFDISHLNFKQVALLDNVNCVLLFAYTFWSYWRQPLRWRVLLTMVLIGVASEQLGIYLLLLYYKNDWLIRCIGIGGAISLLVVWNSKKGKDTDTSRPLAFTTWTETFIICTGYGLGGICEGAFGMGGPSIVLINIWRQYKKEDSAVYSCAFYFATNSVRAVILAQNDLHLNASIFVWPILLGLTAQTFSNFVIAPFVDERRFQNLLTYIVVLTTIEALCTGTLVEPYSKFTLFLVIPIASFHTFCWLELHSDTSDCEILEKNVVKRQSYQSVSTDSDSSTPRADAVSIP